MKRLLLVISLVFFLMTGYSQSQQDKEEVLQLCIELPELQQFLVQEDGSQLTQLKIKSCSSLEQQELSIKKFGKTVQLVDKVELSSLVDKSHIDFFIFEVKNQEARVDFTFSSTMETPKFWAYMELEKKGNTWEVTKLKSEER